MEPATSRYGTYFKIGTNTSMEPTNSKIWKI